MPEISLPSFAFTPQLGWSTTRSETFRACRRRYFYQYYGKFDPEIPLGRILQLKGLSSIPMTVGNAVHDVLASLLKRLLRTATPIDRQRFTRHTERTLDGLLSGLELMETYYKQRPQPELSELLEPVQACLDRFLASERYSWVRDQLSSDPPWLIEPDGYGETRLRGQKIYAKVDVLIRVPGQTVILDWKSGRQDAAKHTRQLLGYSAWAEHNLKIPADEIRCVLAYLQPDYQELEKQPSAAELDGLAVEVAAEIQQMQALCKDPERNIPLEKDAFPLTDNAGICRNCQYRELCDRIDA